MRRLFVSGCWRSGTGALAELLTRDARAIVTIEAGIDNWQRSIDFLSEEDRNNLMYVGDKMPEDYLFRAADLYNEFSTAKFIFTNRNGWDVAASYAYRFLKNQTEKQDIFDVIELIKFGEQIWLKNYSAWKNLSKVLPQDKYIKLKYEDNVNDIENMLKRLGEYLEYNTPVNNRLFWHELNGRYEPFYRPVRKTLFEEPSMQFIVDLIKDTVSDEFKYAVMEYEEKVVT